MSRNQFFYKRVVKANKEGEEDSIVYDSFNLELVIRSFWTDKDVLTILIADGHEDAFTRQEPEIKGGKVIGVKNVKGPKEYVQSQVSLDLEDAGRFRNVSEIYAPNSGLAGEVLPQINKEVGKLKKLVE